MSESWSGWIPILRVEDAQVSAQFYENALGFVVDWEHRFGDNFPRYVQISRPPLVLHLSEHQGGGIAAGEFFVRVPNVDELYQDMLEQGIQPSSAPTDQEYGVRDFCIVDPDGHRITLGTPTDFPSAQYSSPD